MGCCGGGVKGGFPSHPDSSEMGEVRCHGLSRSLQDQVEFDHLRWDCEGPISREAHVLPCCSHLAMGRSNPGDCMLCSPGGGLVEVVVHVWVVVRVAADQQTSTRGGRPLHCLVKRMLLNAI